MTRTVALKSPYSLGEEIANAVTHGVGALLSIAGSAILVVLAALTRDPFKIVSSCIYGGSLILLFTMSTLYHALTNRKAKFIFRVFDHTSIFLLIAGTYTPLTLVSLRGAVGWTIFGIVWGIAILGIVLNSISVERFKKVSMVCYLVAGWCIVAAILPLCRVLNSTGLLLLLAGGILYTVGIIFYKQKKTKYMHSLWHLFVLGGAVFHYFCVLLEVI